LEIASEKEVRILKEISESKRGQASQAKQAKIDDVARCLNLAVEARCGRTARNSILTEVLVFHQTLSTLKASHSGRVSSGTPQGRAE